MAILNQLHKFSNKLNNASGHYHLYGMYERLIEKLKTERLGAEEEDELTDILSSLISEMKVYQCYPYWAARCFLCADGFVDCLSAESEARVYREELCSVFSMYVDNGMVVYLEPSLVNKYHRLTNKGDDEVALLALLRDKGITDTYMINRIYEKCSARKCFGHKERIMSVAICVCFECCDAGRRPHDMYDKKSFLRNFKCGYNLSKEYLAETHDYAAYREWFKLLDPIHIGKLLTSISWTSRNEEIICMLDETLSLQIEMLKDWKTRSAETFAEYDGHKILEEASQLLAEGGYCEIDVGCDLTQCSFEHFRQIMAERIKRRLCKWHGEDRVIAPAEWMYLKRDGFPFIPSNGGGFITVFFSRTKVSDLNPAPLFDYMNRYRTTWNSDNSLRGRIMIFNDAEEELWRKVMDSCSSVWGG